MALAPARISLPDATGVFQDRVEAEYMANLVIRLSQEINARSADITARTNLLLQSPGGEVFAITITDQGVINSIQVSGTGSLTTKIPG